MSSWNGIANYVLVSTAGTRGWYLELVPPQTPPCAPGALRDAPRGRHARVCRRVPSGRLAAVGVGAGRRGRRRAGAGAGAGAGVRAARRRPRARRAAARAGRRALRDQEGRRHVQERPRLQPKVPGPQEGGGAAGAAGQHHRAAKGQEVPLQGHALGGHGQGACGCAAHTKHEHEGAETPRRPHARTARAGGGANSGRRGVPLGGQGATCPRASAMPSASISGSRAGALQPRHEPCGRELGCSWACRCIAA